MTTNESRIAKGTGRGAPALAQSSPFLTVQEVAAKLRVSESTIYEAIRTRRLLARRFGRRWLVTTTDLEDALAGDELA